jgi:hypothetical protein
MKALKARKQRDWRWNASSGMENNVYKPIMSLLISDKGDCMRGSYKVPEAGLRDAAEDDELKTRIYNALEEFRDNGFYRRLLDIFPEFIHREYGIACDDPEDMRETLISYYLERDIPSSFYNSLSEEGKKIMVEDFCESGHFRKEKDEYPSLFSMSTGEELMQETCRHFEQEDDLNSIRKEILDSKNHLGININFGKYFNARYTDNQVRMIYDSTLEDARKKAGMSKRETNDIPDMFPGGETRPGYGTDEQLLLFMEHDGSAE